MSKDNRVVFGVIIGILAIAITILLINNNSKKTEEMNEIVSKVLESSKIEMLYLDNGNCDECAFLSAQMPPLLTDYELGYFYINVKDIPLSKRDDILKKLGITKFDSPMITIYNKGKMVDSLEGVNSLNTVFEFLQKGGIISSDKEPVLNYLDIKSYQKLLKTPGKHLIAIGSAKDSLSNDAQLILWALAKAQGLKINYLVLSDMTVNEGAEFEKSIDYYKESDINIPDLLLIEKGKVIDNLTGLGTEEKYIEFLVNNEIVKE